MQTPNKTELSIFQLYNLRYLKKKDFLNSFAGEKVLVYFLT